MFYLIKCQILEKCKIYVNIWFQLDIWLHSPKPRIEITELAQVQNHVEHHNNTVVYKEDRLSNKG